MTHGRYRSLQLVALGLVVLAAAGCGSSAEPQKAGTEAGVTLDDLREWTAAEFDAAIDASGAAIGWYSGGIGAPEVPWDGDEGHEENLRMLFPYECAGPGTGAVATSLANESFTVPHEEAAERVRAHWEESGWSVTDLMEADAAETYLKATRADGAELSFQARRDQLVVAVQSVCAKDPSLADWMEQVPSDE